MRYDYANKAAEARDPAIAVKLMNLSARLMDTFQGGLLAIFTSCAPEAIRPSPCSTSTSREVRRWSQELCKPAGLSQNRAGYSTKNEDQPHAIGPVRRYDSIRAPMSSASGNRAKALPDARRRCRKRCAPR
jgi:hypothetical protein